MPNRVLTEKIVKSVVKHGDVAEQELDEILESGDMKWSDIDFVPVLEQDFGPGFRDRIQRMSDDAMEAVITSGVFNKMISKVIRTSLMEEPKEQYKMSRLVPTETRGECEDGFEDHGVFSDFQVHELCELEAAPLYGIATDYLVHPRGKQGGVGMAVTREALCRDPNGFVMMQVPKLRDAHDEWRENKILDVFIGYQNTFNRSGTSYDTYYESGTDTPFANGGPWVNSAANDFLCSEDLQDVKNLFYDMRDMVHGRPVLTDVSSLQVVTSREKADAMRPLLLATAVENDASCSGDGATRRYIMTAEVANGMTFDLTSYQRFVDRLIFRHGLDAADARNWWWAGNLSEFMGWVYQITPEVNRCPLGAEECRRRIVAVYNSLSKGYAYVKNPYKGVMLSPSASASA